MDLAFPLPLRGLIIGFTIAAAVGPISLLTIRRTIEHGRVYGLASGLGVATADASYAGVAALGLTAVTGLLVAGRVLLGVVGGAIIALLGVRTMLSRPGVVATDAERPGLIGAFASIYALTMTNPTTILSFAAVFAGIGLVARSATFADAAVVTLAVWIGSALWWVVLTSIVGWLRGRVTTRGLL
jgi:threonine/homoserine/homoserine lactone efflux protein